MNWPTIIIASLVAIVFVAIVVSEVRKRKSGKGACSCGGSCGGCAGGCGCGCGGQEET